MRPSVKPTNNHVSAVNITGELNSENADATTACGLLNEDHSCTVISDADSIAGTLTSTLDCNSCLSSFEVDSEEDDGGMSLEKFVDLDFVLGTNNSRDEIGLLVKEALIDFVSF